MIYSSQSSRRGGVFLFCLGMLLVMVALAYAFMASSRIRRDANENLHMLSFAELAANQGADHAIEVLTRDYLAHPGVPTTMNLDYVQGFAPIDTTRVGKEQRSNVAANAAQYRPQGDPDSREDENENDTKTETLITSVYNSTYQGAGTYLKRADTYRKGQMLSTGLARYIEPGHYHTDLVGKPISFHLEHPVAANLMATDPAIKRGEPWVADVDEPLYLDRDLQPAKDRASARYRLRYAVNIEDLSGHLPLSWQGLYDPTASDARTATPTQADADSTAEVDGTVADRYDASLYNMLAIPYQTKAWWGWLIAHGHGFTNYTHPTGTAEYHMENFPVLSTVVGGIPERYNQQSFYQLPLLPSAAMPKPLVTYGHVWTSNRGPVMSAFAGRAFQGNYHDATPASTSVFTPHGRRPVPVTTPVAYQDSYTDCPWQINLPTAVPQSVTMMLFAYLPAEVKSLVYNDRDKWDFNGFNPNGTAKWLVVPEASDGDESGLRIVGRATSVNLFNDSTQAPTFSHLGSDYPGTDPVDPPAITTVPHWREDLGKGIDLNEATFVATSVEYTHRPPFWGMNHGYMPSLGGDIEEKAETFAGGQRWVLLTPSAGDMSMFTAAKSYAYGDSYYMDVATAFLHAVAVAQLAWMEDNGASSNGYPLDGRPQFPSTLSSSDLAAYLSDGQPSGPRDRDFLDRDADGDGVADSPSAFDSIREVDAQFVRNLGEYFGPQMAATPNEGLYLVKYRPGAWGYSVAGLTRAYDFAEAITYTTNNNIATLLASTDPMIRVTNGEAARMELVVNDMRMSFFGSSPQYPDFQGIDFDNDGTVRCSAYAGGSCPAGADRFGLGTVTQRFSLTGCFLMQKSHFFRVFVRGEIFDQLRNVPVEDTTLEMVYAVDPSGRIYDVNNQPIPGRRDPDGDGDPSDSDVRDSQVLFQRWHWPKYQTYQPRATR